MSQNCLVKLSEEGKKPKNIPPHLEYYKEVTEGDYGVFVSNLHGEAESDGNIDIAKVLARKYKTNAFLLPLIDPQNPEAIYGTNICL